METKQFDSKVLIWTGFSKLIRLPVFVISPQTLNQIVYTDLLSEKIEPILKSKRIWRKSIFQQDGANPHTSNFALKS